MKTHESEPKEPRGHGAKYPHKKTAAVAALLTEPTMGAAARKADVDEKTLWRWRKQPSLQQMIRDEQKRCMDAALAGMNGAIATVIERLVEIVSDRQRMYAKDRLKAAELILNTYFRNKQLFLEFEQQLSGERTGETDDEAESGDDVEEDLTASEDESVGDEPCENSLSSMGNKSSWDGTTGATEPSGQAEEEDEPQSLAEGNDLSQATDGKGRKTMASNDTLKSATLHPSAPQMPADARESDQHFGAPEGADESAERDRRPSAAEADSTGSTPGTAEEVSSAPQMGPDFLEVLSLLGRSGRRRRR